MTRRILSYLNTIKAAKEKGYSVTLFYFWLNDGKLSVERFKMRVSEGGHNIPKETIIRRYFRGMYNLRNKFTALSNYRIVIKNLKDQLLL